MAELKPTSLTALSRVSGVGAAKLDRYGAAFVELIATFEGEAHVSAA
jgi:ATP-dependent DNA helicase RecQ